MMNINTVLMGSSIPTFKYILFLNSQIKNVNCSCILFYSGVLAFNIFCIQSIGSGCGVYDWLFHFTISHQMDIIWLEPGTLSMLTFSIFNNASSKPGYSLSNKRFASKSSKAHKLTKSGKVSTPVTPNVVPEIKVVDTSKVGLFKSLFNKTTGLTSGLSERLNNSQASSSFKSLCKTCSTLKTNNKNLGWSILVFFNLDRFLPIGVKSSGRLNFKEIESLDSTNVKENNNLESFSELKEIVNNELANLSSEQLCCFANLMGFIMIFGGMLSVTSILFGQYLIEYFNLEKRYPKLAKYLKLRQTVEKYYLIINIVIIYFIIIYYIVLNFYMLAIK